MSESSEAADTVRRIRLTWAQSRWLEGRIDGIRLRIEAVDANLMTAKIFAYLIEPMKPATGEQVANFDHVCSPTDIEEYPEDEPLPTHRPGWIRLSYVDIKLRDQTEIDAALAAIIHDVRRLKAALDTMDTLTATGEVWIDEEPPTEEEDDSSDGSSEGSEED